MLKKIFLLFQFLFVLTLVYSQDKPIWVELSSRTMQYPQEAFLQGFARNNLIQGQTIGVLTENVKQLARADLARAVVSSIKSQTSSFSESIKSGGSESIMKQFSSASLTSSNVEINGVTVESYYDKASQTAYAFAYANKYEVIGYYKAKITMEMQKAAGIVDDAKKMEDDGEKLKAIEAYKSVLPTLGNIAFAQGLLIAVDKNANPASLQSEQSKALQQTVSDAFLRLSHGVTACILTQEDCFGSKVYDIDNYLKAELAKNNFNFTTDSQNADWTITVVAKARKYNFTDPVYYCYIDAEIQLTKMKDGKNIYQDQISVKGGHTLSYENAARKAYKQVGAQIATAIIDKMK